MKIGIWHGYLLSGTGSNIYVQNLARSLVKLGNDVVIFCQDFHAFDQDFVNSFDNQHKDTAYHGNCTVYRPDIGNLLPVYVLDDYEGFEVKTFLDLNQEELDDYIDKNVQTLRKVIEEEKIDLLFTNHAVMSPYIASLACGMTPYVSYIHGSAMEFTLKHSPEFIEYASKGLRKSQKILVGSSDMAKRVKEMFKEKIDNLEKKLDILPCGVDLSIFKIDRPIETMNAELIRSLTPFKGQNLRSQLDVLEFLRGFDWDDDIPAQIIKEQATYNYNLPDQEIVENGLAFNPNLENGINLLYVGKFLPTKGIQNILLALPEIFSRLGKKASLTMVGFGKYREHFELLLDAVSDKNPERARKILETDRLLSRSIHELDKVKWDSGNLVKGRVFFTGKLDHNQLSKILPLHHVLIAPSIAPEAFGMVGIEGASCGLMPVTTYSSGFKDITDALRDILTDKQFESLKIGLETPVQDLAEKVPEAHHDRADKKILRATIKEQFTWEAIAKKVMNYKSKI